GAGAGGEITPDWPGRAELGGDPPEAAA
ncbi:MAG: hypothetical protein QOK39_1242, partial [Acidimicrobiaceae bacterium]|nr:hypothetical protein [Acidimicrobiaceae bacterium]